MNQDTGIRITYSPEGRLFSAQRNPDARKDWGEIVAFHGDPEHLQTGLKDPDRQIGLI
jgi:hypothetical protein